MDPTEETLAELKQLRKTQEELLEEYRRVANAALDIQRQAFEVQKGAVAQQSRAVELSARISKWWLFVALAGAAVVAWLIYKLLRLGL